MAIAVSAWPRRFATPSRPLSGSAETEAHLIGQALSGVRLRRYAATAQQTLPAGSRSRRLPDSRRSFGSPPLPLRGYGATAFARERLAGLPGRSSLKASEGEHLCPPLPLRGHGATAFAGEPLAGLPSRSSPKASEGEHLCPPLPLRGYGATAFAGERLAGLPSRSSLKASEGWWTRPELNRRPRARRAHVLIRPTSRSWTASVEIDNGVRLIRGGLSSMNSPFTATLSPLTSIPVVFLIDPYPIPTPP